ncbi:dymeclin-like [Artemia franciscana]|uniref:Dymeclin n=1 Tax=Artemia franciscana TaxID=6661 RepID=A0AA88I508_ARTSF|nr:hypothetical protein QYM36_003555 [Artemia franciscana]
MGQGTSALTDIQSELAEKFTSNESLGPNDPFWNRLLSSFNKTPQTREKQESVVSALSVFNENLLVNNFYTGNVGALMYVFLERSLELKDCVHLQDHLFTWQSYNALFVLRCVLSQWVDRLDESQLQAEFQSVPNLHAGKILYPPDILESFINRLIELLVDLPVSEVTYHLYLEIMNVLLVLCSHQMFTRCWKGEDSSIFRILFSERCRIHAGVLVKRLLANFVQRIPVPHTWFGQSEGGSVVLGLTSSLWNVLTFNRNTPIVEESPLAELSLLVLLVLSYQSEEENPYRSAMVTFSDSEDESEISPVHTSASFKMSYSNLLLALCEHLEDERVSLVLYTLLHEHDRFRQFILVQENIESLVLPHLKVLYGVPSCGSRHVYMILINLLILSESDDFNIAVHSRILKSVPWFTERNLTDISLGGLMIIIILRTVQYNILKTRDRYLHSNCLATLANMASRFRNLSTYVAQRLVSFLETMSKRYMRQVTLVKNSVKIEINGEAGQHPEKDQSVQDLEATEEILQMILGTLNAVLYSQLSNNPNLVYALLYKKEILDIFKNNSTFSDLTYNIATIVGHFSKSLSQNDEVLAVEQIFEFIKVGAQEFSKDRLKVLSELKFRYVEEKHPEEFFLPYIWYLLYQTTELYWCPSSIRLFSSEKQECDT